MGESGFERMRKCQTVMDVRVEKEKASRKKGQLALLGRKSQVHTYLKAS